MVFSIIEYAKNKLLLHLAPKDLLIVHNWEKTHLVIDPNIGNVNKFMLLPFPDFDEEVFPFLVSSGRQFISLDNVKKCTIQKFVKAPVWTDGPQTAIFFTKDTVSVKMHFASRMTSRSNMRKYNWHC